MGERKGTRGLELWCRRMTEGYPGVKIDNMTTSWRDGLAFCAIIHHFRPDLIDFSKLNKNNIYHNNELAFRIAEDHLGIPALLEPEDMVEYSVPDRLSILTYLSQFFQVFAGNQSNSSIKTPPKRPPPADLQMHMVSATGSSPPKKAALRISGARREPCAKCALPVFIAERLNVGKALYHRTCFRCARCDSQLTLANYYETESKEFCCETCPDEEKSSQVNSSILSKSLSDEEKSASLKGESDMYSSYFENVLEDPRDDSLKRNFTIDRGIARTAFLTTQMIDSPSSDSDSESSNSSKPPDLPTSKIPEMLLSDSDSGNSNKPPDLPTSEVPQMEQPSHKHSENIDSVSSNMLPSRSDSGFPNSELKYPLITDQNLDESQNPVTKDSISARDEPESPSIKSRIKLFEGGFEDRCEIRKSDVNRESLKLSEQIDKVPYEKTFEQPSLSAGQSLNENSDKNVSEQRIENVCNTSTVSDNQVERSDMSETNYEGDVSALSESVLTSGQNESVIVISSESSSEENNTEFSPPVNISFDNTDADVLNENETSVIVISDTSEDVVSELHSALGTPASEVFEEPPDKNLKENPFVQVIYPDDLNPFGEDDLSEESFTQEALKSTSLNAPDVSKYVSTNPFGDSDEEEPVVVKPQAAPRRSIPTVSTNPFGSDDEDDVQVEDVSPLPPQPAVRKLIKAPKVSLTPYWTDERKLIKAPKITLSPYCDEANPVPKPRSPRTSARTPSDASSLTGSGRKKKPAPKPPTASSLFNQEANDSPLSSLTSSPSQSVCHSPKTTPRFRKMRKAPLPPGASTPVAPEEQDYARNFTNLSPIGQYPEREDTEQKPLQFRVGSEENLKSAKDEMNRNRQHTSNLPKNEGPSSLPNKSTYGKWKRNKGQAPARPVPIRRTIKSLPINEIKHELELIEVQQQGLEKQGVRLEKLIRERSEVPGSNEDEALAPEVEDMIIQLFELVNEKNELFRKQAELMYLRRQNRLEQEHAEIEYEIRCLMLQPEANKTDTDKAKEEELINRLVEIVERRNQIVDCLEMDRRRAADEDTSISNQMSLFSMRREDYTTSPKKKIDKKDKQKHKKEKKSKSKNKVDADKDIDESETQAVKEKKKKKKFNLF